MKPLKKFWWAIESVLGLAAVSAEWRQLLGPEYALTERFLQAKDRLVRSYPRWDGPRRLESFKVVEHGPNDFVGVCPETGDVVPLAREELIVHAINLSLLSKTIAKACGLTVAIEQIDGAPWLYRLGHYNHPSDLVIPFYLAVPQDSDSVHRVVNILAARNDRPSVLLLPTRRLLGASIETALLHNRGCCLYLDVILALDDTGEFVCRRPIEHALGREPSFSPLLSGAGSVVPYERKPDGFYPPRTIIWRGDAFDCELTKRQIAFYTLAIDKAEIDIHLVMHRGKGAVWREPYRNTKQHRDKISQFLSRLNNDLSATQPPLPVTFSLRRNSEFISKSEPPRTL
jgi:hypothetical protein